MTFEEYIGMPLDVYFRDYACYYGNEDIDDLSDYCSNSFYVSREFFFNYMDYIARDSGLPQSFQNDYKNYCCNSLSLFYSKFQDIYSTPLYVRFRIFHYSDTVITDVLDYANGYCSELFASFVSEHGISLSTTAPPVSEVPDVTASPLVSEVPDVTVPPASAEPSEVPDVTAPPVASETSAAIMVLPGDGITFPQLTGVLVFCMGILAGCLLLHALFRRF